MLIKYEGIKNENCPTLKFSSHSLIIVIFQTLIKSVHILPLNRKMQKVFLSHKFCNRVKTSLLNRKSTFQKLFLYLRIKT